jgi:predicted deacylase
MLSSKMTSTNRRDEYPQGRTRIWTDLDLDAEGFAQGYLRLSVSRHLHGAGWIPIPIINFKSGDGPKVLLIAGNHGDEFEGQVLLMKLLKDLKLSNVKGQILILPAANAPAAYAGTRTSPLDDGNLNRLFPGDPDGTPTQMIAHYIESELLPRVDHVFDFHNGGASMEFIPSAHVFYSPDPKRFEQAKHFLRVFGATHSVIIKGLMGNDQKLFGACERAGVSHMSTELGGAWRVSPVALHEAEIGLRRILFDLGVIHQPMTDVPVPPPPALMTRLPTRRYIYAGATGLFEPRTQLGEEVRAGQVAGAIHFRETPWREPVLSHFIDDGIVIGMRSLGQTDIGDCLFMLGVPWKE